MILVTFDHFASSDFNVWLRSCHCDEILRVGQNVVVYRDRPGHVLNFAELVQN